MGLIAHGPSLGVVINGGEVRARVLDSQHVLRLDWNEAEYVPADQLQGAVADVAKARSLLHEFALDRGSTDGLNSAFAALNAALTHLGEQ